MLKVLQIDEPEEEEEHNASSKKGGFNSYSPQFSDAWALGYLSLSLSLSLCPQHNLSHTNCIQHFYIYNRFQKYKCFKGITIVIGGQFFGWNAGLSAGFGSFLISLLFVGSGFICLICCNAEVWSVLPFSGPSRRPSHPLSV